MPVRIFSYASSDIDKTNYTFNIRELYFPEDFQEIYCAFDHFETLEKITLPKSQTEIQYGSFRYCINLKEFICPDDITIIK